MSDVPVCPKCFCDSTYREGNLIICPACGYQWTEDAENASAGKTPKSEKA